MLQTSACGGPRFPPYCPREIASRLTWINASKRAWCRHIGDMAQHSLSDPRRFANVQKRLEIIKAGLIAWNEWHSEQAQRRADRFRENVGRIIEACRLATPTDDDNDGAPGQAGEDFRDMAHELTRALMATQRCLQACQRLEDLHEGASQAKLHADISEALTQMERARELAVQLRDHAKR